MEKMKDLLEIFSETIMDEMNTDSLQGLITSS